MHSKRTVRGERIEPLVFQQHSQLKQKKGEAPATGTLPFNFSDTVLLTVAAYRLELMAGRAGVALLGVLLVDFLLIACRLAAVAVVAEIRGRLDQANRSGGMTHVALQVLGTDMPVMYGFPTGRLLFMTQGAILHLGRQSMVAKAGEGKHQVIMPP